MSIPTEPIGSIPRPPDLMEAVSRHGNDSPRARVLGTELASRVLQVA